ncbi:elongation factor 1-delta isoform X2 [Protopterus annectens]|uniref:elongation factor 1-delta isoform X2 n=1 Tax=Protopterus annectens TaxID=7888 RepID=UPI001CFB00AF|nr:elongation factor 1-delta isoform X2 [Protopterus annectens]
MRTRQHPYLLETIWMDKYKYDEAEKLFYEEQAMLTALEAACTDVVHAVSGNGHRYVNDDALKATRNKARNGNKRRKHCPITKKYASSVDFVSMGLQAEHVWYNKYVYEEAEAMYHKQLADLQGLSAIKEKLPLVSEVDVDSCKSILGSDPQVKGLPCKPEEVRAALSCSHSVTVACHHIVHNVWLNKLSFDDAECRFLERPSGLSVPQHLEFLPLKTGTDFNAPPRGTPDEGYGTAVPTPATPATPGLTRGRVISAEPTSGNLPDLTAALAPNGKPHLSSLQELVSEVWYNKRMYDDAERRFYENMYSNFPAAKEEQLQSTFLYPVGKNKKSTQQESSFSSREQHCVGVLSQRPVQAVIPTLVCYFLHHDSELVWTSKSMFDNAERCYFEFQANQMKIKTLDQQNRGSLHSRTSVASAPCTKTSNHLAKAMETTCLGQEKIWFDKWRFDDAERQFYEQQNGPVTVCSSSQETGASTILQDIARARENIQKSLSGTTTAAAPLPAPSATTCVTISTSAPAADYSGLIERVANLELENHSLRQVIEDLRQVVSKLENRITAVEKCPVSSQPDPVPAPAPAPVPKSKPTATANGHPAEEDDDDIDLFGSDDEDEESEKLKEERLRQYAEKKAKKPTLIAKSSILLDVKPWDDETDMAKMEECVRSIQMDGLVWGTSKLVPVGYGIKKLQIQCVVEDDKVGTDELEEEIIKFEDYVQSMDIAAFNKI